MRNNQRRAMFARMGKSVKITAPKKGYISFENKKGDKIVLKNPVLQARYDGRKQFYGKAKVENEIGNDALYSYGTRVAQMKDGKPIVFGTYSTTTLRHIKEFLKQHGFKAESSKQILKDYGGIGWSDRA